MQLTTAVTAGYGGLCVIVAIVVFDADRCSVFAFKPAITPGAKCKHEVSEVGTLRCELVITAFGMLLVLNAKENSRSDKSFKPIRHDGLLCAGILDKVGESSASIKRITNDHEAPSITHFAQGTCDRAWLS